VPPVPGHSNDNTDSSLGTISDISTIAVNADSYEPCFPRVELPLFTAIWRPSIPARFPPMPRAAGLRRTTRLPAAEHVISPFVRQHYVSHIPMDHTAVIKFVENRFINSGAHLTAAMPLNRICWTSLISRTLRG